MSNINYTEVVNHTREAIKADNNSANKWVICGRDIAAFFGSEAALSEVKAQFITDAILPAIDKRHAEALAKDLPRKGSKEFNELCEANRVKWDAANEAKKAARATCATYFSRIVAYAFPKEKQVSEPASDTVKIAELITQALKKCEKSETLECDAEKLHKALSAALSIVTA